ncbi:archease [Streptomyces broussonetiae]|uniref:Archease n=1 Tax=Streptomyces broussonetiae TaxID=2686304 RepID=A0ABV5EIU2_9ACTN
MVGDPDDVVEARRRGASGHRALPHTADVRIEAWGASRERCLAEAVVGMVECFADVADVRPSSVERLRPTGPGDAELLAGLLDEVIYRMEVYGQVTVDVAAGHVGGPGGGLEVRLAVAGVSDVEITGAVPKAVSWHELRMGPDPYGWSCAVTIDA